MLFFYSYCFLPSKIISQTQQRPSQYRSVYIGTFSSVSVIHGDTSLFNDTLTQISNYTYDSVITSRVKFITPVNTIKTLSEKELKDLTTELTQGILHYNGSQTVYSTESPLLDSIASRYDNRYSSYFVTYGNIWSKKENRKYLAGRTLMVSAVAIGVVLLAIVTAPIGGLSDMDTDWFGKKKHGEDFLGMNCYYLVYDKQTKQICYVIKDHFRSEKTDNNPFHPKRVEKQIESLFYLPH